MSIYSEARECHNRKQYEKAYKLYDQGAAAGDEKCYYGIALFLKRGYFVEKDEEKANKIFAEYFDAISALAEAGDAEAMLILFSYYHNGYYVEKDKKKGLEWISKAANQGNSEALWCLGDRYRLDKEIEDLDKALELYHKSADQGNSDGQWLWGFMYYTGCGVQKNYATAAKWYQISADHGNSEAQWRLGHMHQYGEFFEKNLSKAAKWYRMSADQGNINGQSRLGYMYEFVYGVDKDIAEAAKWYRISADQGDIISQNDLGYMYEFGEGVEKDIAEAVKWYKKAADQGYAISQCRLGEFYQFAIGVQEDQAQAVEWYRKSAEQGDSDGQWHLGYMYQFGKGVEKDPVQAVEWYRKSAEQGNSEGQWRLGHMYHGGNGIDKDIIEAVKWYRKSAKQDDSTGQMLLGTMYEYGDGVKKNLVEAVKWYKKSAKNNCSIAQLILGKRYKDGIEGIIEPDIYKAIEWWKKAAENEYPEPKAMYLLGYAYYDGEGVERNLQKSKECFENAIKYGYRCSYALNMVKNELQERDHSSKMREYAELLAKKAKKSQKFNIVKQISDDLQDEFGAAWQIADETTKTALRSGLLSYYQFFSLGVENFGDLDFSPTITQLCKALENELGKYMYSGYIKYLEEHNISPNEFSDNRSFINKHTKAFNKSTDMTKFTLGSLEATVGLNHLTIKAGDYLNIQYSIKGSKGQIFKYSKQKHHEDDIVEYTIDKTMVEYFHTIFKPEAVSEEQREREITDYIVALTQEVKSIADSFRNPAAHIQKMKCARAEACGDAIIKVQKLLINFLDKIKE